MATNLTRKRQRPAGTTAVVSLATISLSLLCWSGPRATVAHGAEPVMLALNQDGGEEEPNPVMGEATRLTDKEIVVDDERYRLAPDVELKTQEGRSLTRSQVTLPTQVLLRFRGERVVVIVQGEWPR